jgi:NAD(P)H-flavin reductase
MLHGVSYEHDLAWREELSELAAAATSGGFPLQYAATISRPGEAQTWHGLTGRAEAVLDAHLDANQLTAANTTIYLCGNPEMVSAVDEIAARRGFAPEQVRKELYWPKGREH